MQDHIQQSCPALCTLPVTITRTHISLTYAAAEAVRVAFEFFSQRAALGFAIPEWLPTPGNLQYHSAVSQLDSAVYGIIADRKQRLSSVQGTPPRRNQVRCDWQQHHGWLVDLIWH